MKRDDKVWLAYIAAYAAPLVVLAVAALRNWRRGLRGPVA
jgi:hypothetical protein